MAMLANPRWETFARCLNAGLPQCAAYRAAFPASQKWRDATIDTKACLLAEREELRARCEELKQEAAHAAGGAVMTRNEKRALLARIARDEALSSSERQRAIDMDNKMEDEYESRVKLSETIHNPFAGLTTEELRALVNGG